MRIPPCASCGRQYQVEESGTCRARIAVRRLAGELRFTLGQSRQRKPCHIEQRNVLEVDRAEEERPRERMGSETARGAGRDDGPILYAVLALRNPLDGSPRL